MSRGFPKEVMAGCLFVRPYTPAQPALPPPSFTPPHLNPGFNPCLASSLSVYLSRSSISDRCWSVSLPNHFHMAARLTGQGGVSGREGGRG